MLLHYFRLFCHLYFWGAREARSARDEEEPSRKNNYVSPTVIRIVLVVVVVVVFVAFGDSNSVCS